MIRRLNVELGKLYKLQFSITQNSILVPVLIALASYSGDIQSQNTLHPSQREQAQIEQWLKIGSDGWTSMVTGNRVDARCMATQVIDLAEEEFDSTIDQTDALYSLGTTYWKQNRHISAEAVLLITLTLQEDRYSSDEPKLLETLASLEEVYSRQLGLSRRQHIATLAVSATEKRMIVAQKRFGYDHPEIAAILLEGGKACAYYSRDGQYGAPLLEQALNLYEKEYGPDHFYVSETLEVLSVAYTYSEQHEKRQAILSRITDREERVKGDTHPDYIEALERLAQAYQRNKHFALAEQARLRLIEILEKIHGPQHLGVAKAHQDLGRLYFIRGKYRKAKPILQRSLEIYQQSENELGIGIFTIQTLAETHFALGEFTKAETLQLELVMNDLPARFHLTLADIYIATQRYAEAEAIYEQLIEEEPTRYDVGQIVIMGKKAELYIDSDRVQEANRIYDDILLFAKKATAHQEQVYKHTPAHRRDYDAPKNVTIANCYMVEERYAEAKPLYESLLDNSRYSDDWNIRYNLAKIYESESRDKLALTYYKRSLALTEKQHGGIHPEVAKQLEALAVFYLRRDQKLLAYPPRDRAFSIYRSAYGPAHSRHIQSVQQFATLYRSLGHVRAAEELEDMLHEIQLSTKKL